MLELLSDSISDEGGLGLIPAHSCLSSVSLRVQAYEQGRPNDLRLPRAILYIPYMSAPLHTPAHSHIQVAGGPYGVPLWGDCAWTMAQTERRL